VGTISGNCMSGICGASESQHKVLEKKRKLSGGGDHLGGKRIAIPRSKDRCSLHNEKYRHQSGQRKNTKRGPYFPTILRRKLSGWYGIKARSGAPGSGVATA